MKTNLLISLNKTVVYMFLYTWYYSMRIVMEDEMRDIPTTEDCRVADPELWERFQIAYENLYGHPNTEEWTEEEVHQFMDLEYEQTREVYRRAA